MKTCGFKKGQLVMYHPVITRPETDGKIYQIRTDPSLMHSEWVVWLDCKTGFVTVKALEHYTGPAFRSKVYNKLALANDSAAPPVYVSRIYDSHNTARSDAERVLMTYERPTDFRIIVSPVSCEEEVIHEGATDSRRGEVSICSDGVCGCAES